MEPPEPDDTTRTTSNSDTPVDRYLQLERITDRLIRECGTRGVNTLGDLYALRRRTDDDGSYLDARNTQAEMKKKRVTVK